MDESIPKLSEVTLSKLHALVVICEDGLVMLLILNDTEEAAATETGNPPLIVIVLPLVSRFNEELTVIGVQVKVPKRNSEGITTKMMVPIGYGLTGK